jgi:hypothetical protein
MLQTGPHGHPSSLLLSLSVSAILLAMLLAMWSSMFYESTLFTVSGKRGGLFSIRQSQCRALLERVTKERIKKREKKRKDKRKDERKKEGGQMAHERSASIAVFSTQRARRGQGGMAILSIRPKKH